MAKRLCLITIMLCLLSLHTSWAAESYLGHKLHAGSKRLFMGGGDFSSDSCGDKLLKTLLIYNVDSGEKVETLQFERGIWSYDVQPSGSIGVFDMSSNLHIYDVGLKPVVTIPHVVGNSTEILNFEWNAAGDKLAYLAFHPDPGIRMAYNVPYIIDLATGTREKIADYANSIRWAKHDGNIYYKIPTDEEADYGVYKYDPATKATTKTNLLGVEFSADGKYYVGSRTEGWEEEPYNLVYRTATNKAIPDAAVDVEKVYDLGRYNHFLGTSHKVLTQWGAPIAIFDPDTRTYARKDIPKGLIGWSDDDTMLVIAEEGCKVRIENALTGQLVKELTIDPGN